MSIAHPEIEYLNDQLDVEEYSQDNNHFRQSVDFRSLSLLPNFNHKHFTSRLNYDSIVSTLPPVIFISLDDVATFIRTKKLPGFDAISLPLVTDIVCDYLADENCYHEMMFGSFDENIVSNIIAQTGDSENEALNGTFFEQTINAINDIATIISNYLINAEAPLLGRASIYTLGGSSDSGIIGLRLRSYDEVRDHLSLSDEDDDDDSDIPFGE